MPRGRLKKHTTADTIAEARRERNRQYYVRRRQNQGLPEFIAHEP